MNRRRFLAAAGAAPLLLGGTRPFAAARADGRKYRTALIGSGWWGMNILREAVAAGRSKVVALCDVDSRSLATAGDEINDLNGEKPKVYQDFRDLFDREKPEVAIVATPDHWHALITIAA